MSGAGSESRGPEADPHGEERTASAPGRVAAPGLEHIDEYRLIELIGEGGMGEVYKAEQRGAIRRLVALKVIRLGLDTKTVIARFNAERQALALMNHPNIAKVFDGGSTRVGRPYFVMEYVAGEPITTYCDRHRLPIRARLELFAQVCDAVQHAHTKGIIHRDLKASNVLVTEQDGRPAPKVIDFGVAKAINQRLTEQTLFTETGRLVGTPAYTSPEQAEGGVDVDTRSDVYSLGVLLYELLTGALPFDPTKLRELAYGEMQRVIREVDPPRPSTFYSTPSDASREAALKRAASVEELASALRKELEWIPLRAMRKERSERYQTAADFARDIQNYLAGKPLIAAPDSRIYRWRKSIRRNRGLAAAVAAVVLALLLGLVATSWQTWRAEQQKDLAEANAAEAKANAAEAQERLAHATASAQLLDEIFKGILPDSVEGKDTELLVEILRRTEPKLEEILTEPSWRAYHLVLLGDAYRLLGDYDRASEVLKRAKELAQESYDEAVAAGRFEANFKEVRTLCDAMERYAELLLNLGDAETAESLCREALDLSQKHLPPDDPTLALRLADLGTVLSNQGKYDEVKPFLEKAVQQMSADPGQFLPEDHAHLALVMAGYESRQTNYDKAETHLNQAEQWLIQAGRTRSSLYARLLSYRGALANRRGMREEGSGLLDQAIELRRQLAPNIDARSQAIDLAARGAAAVRLAQPDVALPAYQEALRIRQEVLRDASLSGLALKADLSLRVAWMLHELHRREESREVARQAMDLFAEAAERAKAEEGTATTQPSEQVKYQTHRLEAMQRWAQVSVELGDAQAALPVIRQCLAQQQERYRGDSSNEAQRWIAISEWVLAEAILATSPQELQKQEAIRLLLSAHTTFARINEPMDRTMGDRTGPRENVLRRLIAFYEQEGNAAEAQRFRDELRALGMMSMAGSSPGGTGGTSSWSGSPASALAAFPPYKYT